MFFGFAEYEISGDNYTKIYKYIMNNNIPCADIRERKGILYLKTGVEYKSELEDVFRALNMDFSVIKRKGLAYRLKKLLVKKGIIAGGIAAFVIALILSNMLWSIEIMCDDADIQKDIKAVLAENGVSSGSFLPSNNYRYLERQLKQKVDGISWAGISVKGTSLIIDVVENVEEPEYRKSRLPCDLVATHDAVIEKVEVYDGQLVTPVGSGVRKGDVLVSGTIVNEKIYYKNGEEMKDIYKRYARSCGTVYGTFTQKMTFFQPFTSSEMVVSEKSKDRAYLKILDVNIPLFLNKTEGNYTEETSYTSLKLFGAELPVGIIHSKLNEYSYEEHTLSKEKAMAKANEQKEKYEHNFLGDYEIKSTDKQEEYSEEGVTLTVEYTLYGNISEEVEFFINK